MAAALSPPRVPKPKGTAPTHYYESFLEKKGPGDQDYRKYWAGLQGLTISFYNSSRDVQPVEKLDLRLFSKLTDEAPSSSAQDCSSHFRLLLRDQEIKLRAESLESREMWKGFILTVVELRVPSNLTLLPGQMYRIAEVQAKEEARRALEVPWCFLRVSRLEAQLLLERYPECGNLLLRPSGDGKEGVSVTTRQMLNGSPVVRHYKVKLQGSKYVIDVEDPFPCSSLDAVVNYFVTHTQRALLPFLLDEDYEKVLGFVEADQENGESVWATRSAQDSGPVSPANIPKRLPPVPTPVSSQEERPPPLPTQLPDQDENYVTPIGDTPAAAEYVNQDMSPSTWLVHSKPKKAVKLPVKPPKPPVVPKPDLKAFTGVWARKPGVSSPQALSLVTKLGDVTAELEEKLQKRRALEH